jgi:ABC-type phosphate/phosphonate transport system substrate-binding protein
MKRPEDAMIKTLQCWWSFISHCHAPRLVIFIMAALLLWALPASVSADQDDGMPKVLRAGFLSRIFADIDIRDAQATLELLTREISRNMGLNTNSRVIIFSDMTSMTNAIRDGELDIVSMPTVEYLRIRDRVPLIPSFVGAHNNGMGTKYLLIARRDKGIRSFSDLKGKNILLPQANKYEESNVWLDVLLMKEGKTKRTSFFGQVRESPKVSHSIMEVFFRQADGAIVTRAALDASGALNPQIYRQLTVLAESQFLSDGVTCLLPTTSETLRRTLVRAIQKVNESTSGRQLYTIFQTSGTLPFKPAYLEGLEELLAEQARLKTNTAKRK